MVEGRADVAIVGTGAAGLMAGIWAGRTERARRIVCLDGAEKLGAKILIAGGGRCNVTHDVVEAAAFAGGSQNAIKKVLRRFDVEPTIAFFRGLGVELTVEPGGKMFPVSNQARSVLDALRGGAQDAGVVLRHPWRVEQIVKVGEGFTLDGPQGRIVASSVVLATGGRSVARTGSDGHGYALAQALGHTIVPTFPALVPLLLPPEHFLPSLRGIATDVRLELRAGTGKRLLAMTGSLLCTHRGVSGPVVLDMSRHWLAARETDPAVQLCVSWVPGLAAEEIGAQLHALGTASPGRWLHQHVPERLARALCMLAGVDPSAAAAQMSRTHRRQLIDTLTALPLPITGDRGFDHAEVTAGGVPLTELKLETMGSRACPGLHLCGEILDVDGRIGGYNFQWAWASGYVAGVSVGRVGQ